MKKYSKKIGFEDWYIRLVDAKGEKIVSCNMRLNKISSSMQGSLKCTYDIGERKGSISVSVTDVMSDETGVHFGQSVINKENIILDVQNAEGALSGHLELEHVVDLNRSFLQPGMMGIYKYVPFMEFYQEVVVLRASTVGVINVDGEEVDFTGGSCYIQKQWGSKFPNIWVWAQCSGFDDANDTTLTLGIARLKVLFNYYTAFTIPIYYNEQVEIFSNYNGGQIAKLYRYKGYLHLIITQKDKLLDVKIYGRDELECISSKETHGIRDVYECDKVKMEVKISEKGNMLWEGTSLGCHIEMGGNTSKLK